MSPDDIKPPCAYYNIKSSFRSFELLVRFRHYTEGDRKTGIYASCLTLLINYIVVDGNPQFSIFHIIPVFQTYRLLTPQPTQYILMWLIFCFHHI